MFGRFFDSNEKQLKRLKPLVEKINSLESTFEKMSQEELRAKTNKWHEELLDIEDYKVQQSYLDEILPEAYAVVREGAKRTLGQRHFDVQLMAGIVLHQGKIAEQKTGEGKTLTATLPIYLNALTGRGVHLVTPNDYLSRHGAGWMGQIYNFLGLEVGAIMQERAFYYDPEYESSEFKDTYSKRLRPTSRQDAYKKHITYGTNHEFGFDYLRDNMAYSLKDMVQTNTAGEWGVHNYAIVDEVDSILIDVARTPLIISTSADQASERYHVANNIVKQLIKDTDYDLDEKFNSVTLTDLGIRRVEKLLGVKNLYEEDFEMVHLIEQSLRAHTLNEKDKDYVVKDGKVVIVDQFTGRLLPSNRFAQGLHQAIEAKEGVEIQKENKTRAEISYQNYFKKYSKLAGMTATAATEAEEFDKIYNMDVVVIPTNKPVQRKDHNDIVYKTEAGKFKAVADEIAERNELGQPVLVGTTSVEKSQLLHTFLNRRNIKHTVLNAKNHEEEALIIAQAGKKGAVTISTNMAGRGVDIILGGDPSTPEEKAEILELGGLHVIGTERHESRRIDDQLRGRSGRQGDVGSSRFYVSLQDDLMRIFGGAKIENLMNRIGLDDTVPLEARLVSKSIENAQKKVEGFNFDRRKQLVDMDDVMNVHREVVYRLRRRILEISSGNYEHRDWFYTKVLEQTSEDSDFENKWQQFEEELGETNWSHIVGQISMPVVDMLWMEHLVDMSNLRDGIGLQGYAQKDPIVEYKREGHERFDVLIARIYASIGERIAKIDNINVVPQSQAVSESSDLEYTQGSLETGVAQEKGILESQQRGLGAGGVAVNMNPRELSKLTKGGKRSVKIQKVVSGEEKVGRNDPCPCGSGKKYKRCHGKA